MTEDFLSSLRSLAETQPSNAIKQSNDHSNANYREMVDGTSYDLLKCKAALDRATKMGALERLKRCGFDPIAVIDIGAQLGTPSLFSTFPNSKHLWIEPVEECLPQLNSLAGNLKDAHVIHAAAANKDGITELSIADNLSYSSIEEKRGSISRQIKTYKVDTLAKQFSISGQVLIKIDVDGAELNVLTGSVELLGLPDIVIIIEASIGDRNPRIAPIVQFLGRLGYDVFDIIEPLYSLSERLWQVDLVFVQRRSVYWGSREFLALD